MTTQREAADGVQATPFSKAAIANPSISYRWNQDQPCVDMTEGLASLRSRTLVLCRTKSVHDTRGAAFSWNYVGRCGDQPLGSGLGRSS